MSEPKDVASASTVISVYNGPDTKTQEITAVNVPQPPKPTK